MLLYFLAGTHPVGAGYFFYTVVMSELFTGIAASLQDPHARHAMMVHLPIAGALLAVPLTIALALTKFKNHGVRWSTVAVLFFAMVGAGLASGAGEEAISNVRIDTIGTLSPDAARALERHEGYGEGGWMWPALAMVLVGITSAKQPKLRICFGSAAVLAVLVVAGWATLAGHTGGVLVYEHGLGVPLPNSVPLPAAASGGAAE